MRLEVKVIRSQLDHFQASQAVNRTEEEHRRCAEICWSVRSLAGEQRVQITSLGDGRSHGTKFSSPMSIEIVVLFSAASCLVELKRTVAYQRKFGVNVLVGWMRHLSWRQNGLVYVFGLSGREYAMYDYPHLCSA